jgi:hypothetical protein
MFTCKIDALIEEIEARLFEIQRKYNIKLKDYKDKETKEDKENEKEKYNY